MGEIMKNKIIASVLLFIMLTSFFSISVCADEENGAKILHTFYSDGAFNARHQHAHVLSYCEYANTEKANDVHGGSALKFTGHLYLQEKTGAKNFAEISSKIEQAIDAGAAYLTYWAYVNETNILPTEEHYASFDLYLPSNPRTRGEWIFVTQKLTNKNQNQLYFKSVGVYTWLDDINIMIIPPDDPSMSIENVNYKGKDGSIADDESVYYKSAIEIDFSYFIDSEAENTEIKVLKMPDEELVETKSDFKADKITLSPISSYEKDTEYKIVLENITNIFGEKLEKTEISFKTAKAEKRVENIEVKSNGEPIKEGDSISSVTLTCDIINDNENPADLNLVFAVEKNGETVKATATDCNIDAKSDIIGKSTVVENLKTYTHSEEYAYKTYILENDMLPVEYERASNADTMDANANLIGDALDFKVTFASGEKRAVAVFMAKAINDVPDFNSIGYFKTGIADEDGNAVFNGVVSPSVETGDYFLLIYGDGVAPYSIKVHYTGEDIRNRVASVIKDNSGAEIKALLEDPEKTIDLKSMGIMLDEYNLISEYADYICTQTANDIPESENYSDCVKMLNRYIVLANLKASEGLTFADIILSNKELLALEDRVTDVFVEAKNAENSTSYSIITDFKNYNTFTEFTEKIKSIAAITSLNLISGNDYPAVSESLENFEDIIGIDTETIFKEKGISQYDRTLVLKELIGMGFTDINSINDVFSAAIKKYMPQERENSSGGGGKSSVKKSSFAVSGDVDKVIESLENKNVEILFNDIKGFEWAAPAINRLNSVGMISGYPDKTFKPEAPIKRSEFIKIIVSGMFADVETADCSFSDVAKDDWCYPYVAKAAYLGLVNGISETYFGADEYVTRQQMAVICKRVIDKLSIKTGTAVMKKFADSKDISEYAKEAVKSLQMSGIINGDENECFNPNRNLSRAEAAKVIFEIYSLMEGQYEKQNG